MTTRTSALVEMLASAEAFLNGPVKMVCQYKCILLGRRMKSCADVVPC